MPIFNEYVLCLILWITESDVHLNQMILQLVDKLTTDEDIQDVEFDLNDVSATCR
jgi:hypothetical protein